MDGENQHYIIFMKGSVALLSKSKLFVRILMICLSATILVGVGVMSYFIFISEDTDTIELKITTNGSKTVEFHDLGLIPGASCEYSIALRSDVKGEYSLSIRFTGNGRGTLQNYIFAKLYIDGEIICDRPLHELFDDGNVTFSSHLSKKEGADIIVVYYMPEDIGNEAEGATADFNLIIDAVEKEAK
jgi:hypothetical protein